MLKKKKPGNIAASCRAVINVKIIFEGFINILKFAYWYIKSYSVVHKAFNENKLSKKLTEETDDYLTVNHM